VEKGSHFENMLIRPLRLGAFWPILYIKFFEVYLSQSNRETFCCNLFQVKCYISPAIRVIIVNGNRNRNRNYSVQFSEIGMRSRNYFENGD